MGDKSSVATIENGVAEPASDTPSEARLAESEHATNASSNNDMKGRKAYQEADVPGLYNLAMAIVEYIGHRVVAHVINQTYFCTDLLTMAERFAGMKNFMK
nr:clustered mitochondria protein [Tanacetum cinerariifolium]